MVDRERVQNDLIKKGIKGGRLLGGALPGEGSCAGFAQGAQPGAEGIAGSAGFRSIAQLVGTVPAVVIGPDRVGALLEIG